MHTASSNGIRQTIGGVTFPTKAAVVARVRVILNTTPKNKPLEGEDFNVIRSLLDFHPDAQQKIGSGVNQITVRPNGPGRTGNGFWIIRTDGTETDFSYKSCIEGDKAFRDKFYRACRTAVSEFTEEFRRHHFRETPNLRCPLTGESVTEKTCQVDHMPPYTFQRIVDAFCLLNGIDPDEPHHCEHGIDGQVVPTFTSTLLRDRFVAFHTAVAQLRVISASANLSVVKKAAKEADL